MAVDPAARRRGWGAALVEMAAGIAREAGAVELFLEVAADNAAAIEALRKPPDSSASA